MNKLVLTFFIVIGVANSTFSQKWSFNHPEIGIQNVNIATIPGNGFDDFYISFGALYKFNDKLRLIIPVSNKLGVTDMYWGTYYTDEYKNIALALMPSINYKPFKFLSFEVGGFASRIVYRKAVTYLPIPLNDQPPYSRNWDFGVTGGFKLHYRKFYINYKNAFGLYDTYLPGNSYGSKLYSMQTILSFGFQFDLSKPKD